MTRIAPALALLLLAGCARSEEASLIPPDSNQGYNQAGRVGTPEQDDSEPAIGQWRASLQENASALEFGPIGTEPLFSMLCTGAPGGPLPDLQLAAGEQNVRLPVTAGGGTIPMLRADVPLNHPLLAALAQGGQPLIIRIGNDTAPLIIPASPLVGDYLRGCTQAAPLPAANAAVAPANSAAPATNQAAALPAPAANAAQPKQ
jgi:hypothetical protein